MTHHVYDYRVRPGSVGAIVPGMVAAGGRVLELGTGPGAITKQLHAAGCKVTGLELDPEAIALVAPYCERTIQCDLNKVGWEESVHGERFDAIVLTDVLEHLYDPWITLRTIAKLLPLEGSVVASLPHVAHSALIAGLLVGRFDYQPWGLLDRTHIRFFALQNMQALFSNAGLKVVEVAFVTKTPEQTEFFKHWKLLPEATRTALASARHGNVYQVVIKAVHAGAPGMEIDICAVPPGDPAPGKNRMPADQNPIVRFLVSKVGSRARERIADTARRLGLWI